MKAEKHGDGYRVTKMINGKKHYIKFDHKPKQSEIEEEVARIRNGLVTTQNAHRKTFDECIDNYIEVKYNVLSPASVRKYRDYQKGMPKWFAERTIGEIDQIAVQKLINDYAKTHAPKSTKSLHGFVSGVLKLYNPSLVLKTKIPQQKKVERYIPTNEEAKAIIDASKGSRYYIPFRLACYGFRRSEICAMVYPDDFDGNIVRVSKAEVRDEHNNMIVKETKTEDSTREVTIAEDLYEMIAEQGYVYDGSCGRLTAALHRYQKQLGIPEFRLHDFRAYFATELHEAHVADEDICHLGGWKTDYVMKRVYRHSRIQKDREAQKQASDIIFNNTMK